MSHKYLKEKANKINLPSHNFLKEKIAKLNKYANNKSSKCH